MASKIRSTIKQEKYILQKLDQEQPTYNIMSKYKATKTDTGFKIQLQNNKIYIFQINIYQPGWM